METIRLNKYISENGICSRREADRQIEEGHVFVNGKRAGVGQRVLPGDKVNVNGIFIQPKARKESVFLAFNKPTGVTSTTDTSVPENIIDFVNYSSRVFPIGRLDKDSQGLIFLTSDGDIVNKILRAGNEHEKEYLVTVDKLITNDFLEGMRNGVPMLGTVTRKCAVSQEAPFIFKIVLVQGLNRQIRRMCEHFGYGVKKLERTRIMNVSLKGIPLGEWRFVTPEELRGIYTMVEKSSNVPLTKTQKELRKPDAHKRSKVKAESSFRSESKRSSFKSKSKRTGGRRNEKRRGK